MSTNYIQAVEMADVLSEHGGTPESLVALGYRAALQDSVRALKEGAAVTPSSDDSRRLYAIVFDKFGTLARVSEARAKELGV